MFRKAQLSAGSPVVPRDGEQALMVAVKKGDVHAFQGIYDRFKGPLLSYVSSLVREKNMAEDLTQDIFMKAYRARESYEPTAKVSTWLWTIARNTCIDYLRRSSRAEILVGSPDESQEDSGTRPSLDLENLDSELPNAEALLVEQVDQQRLQRCLASLPLAQQETLILRTVSELPYEEIAVATHTSLSAVKSLLFRAKKSLLSCMGGNE